MRREETRLRCEKRKEIRGHLGGGRRRRDDAWREMGDHSPLVLQRDER